MRRQFLAIASALLLSAGLACAQVKPEAEKPDFERILTETTNEQSKYYYPKLLKQFLANDTVMTPEDYRYFYYGALFQEDYDPYRAPYKEEELCELTPLYYRSEHKREEKEAMMRHASEALRDNPLDLDQLQVLIFVYEQNKKVNLAKIWKNKLNNLLRAIASSGTGIDPDNAWYVVYPRHEFDFLNISGITVQSKEFQAPYYEKVNVNTKSDKDPAQYYFNLQPVLEQYYIKHPSEPIDD